MTEETTPAHVPAPAAPVVQPGMTSGLLKKLTSGSTFLTLEHVAHMALVVVVSVLMMTGISGAWSMWLGGSSSTPAGVETLVAVTGAGLSEATTAIFVVSALLVLVPALVILDLRTRAEWQKRHDYAGRLAYKAPIYTALGVLTATIVGTVISLVSTLLSSLAFIGVEGYDIGGSYVHSFLPSLFSLAVFAGAALYVFRLLKGRDIGRTYSMAVAFLSTALLIALFVTSIVITHDNGINATDNTKMNSNTTPSQMYNNNSNSNSYDW
jgi:hypothetical protein